MKTLAALILAAAAVRVQAQNKNWNADADPCSALHKAACQEDDLCVFTLKPRSHENKREKGILTNGNENKNYGRHSGPKGKGGNCAARHVHDRANQMSTDKKADMFAKHGLHSEWDEIACEEAFFLKDCKDVSQHGTVACDWKCGGGCVPAGDEGSKYQNCYDPSPGCTDDGYCVPPVALTIQGVRPLHSGRPVTCETLGYGNIESAEECHNALDSYGYYLNDGGNDEFGTEALFEGMPAYPDSITTDVTTVPFGCSFPSATEGMLDETATLNDNQRSFSAAITAAYFNSEKWVPPADWTFGPPKFSYCYTGSLYCICKDPRKLI